MFRHSFLHICFVLLSILQLHAKSDYETVTLLPNDNVASVLKSSNKRFIIISDYDLNGKEVVLGANTVLSFQGGSFSNGKIKGNNTVIEAGLETIFKNIENTGTFQCVAIYPQWFGAIADGKHDCADALQLAIDFAVNSYVVSNPWDIQAVEGNCLKIEVPAGSYVLRKPIYLRDYTHLVGQGRGITKIVNGGIDDGRALVYCGDQEDGSRRKVNNARICDLSINGNDKRCIGIYTLAQYSFIENVFITKCKNYGIYSYESWCTYIKNCHFIYNAIDTDGYTIYMTGKSSGRGANAVTISECEFIGQEIYDSIKNNNRVFKGNCIFSENGNGIRIINSTFQQLNNCISLNSSGTGIAIENCYFEAVNTPIIGILYGINIVNNFFTAPIYSNAIIRSNRLQGCHIINNIVSAGLSECVIVARESNDGSLLIYGNTFTGNFRSGSELSFSKDIVDYLKNTKSNQVITNTGNIYNAETK